MTSRGWLVLGAVVGGGLLVRWLAARSTALMETAVAQRQQAAPLGQLTPLWNDAARGIHSSLDGVRRRRAGLG